MTRNLILGPEQIMEQALKARSDMTSLEQLLENKELQQRFLKIAHRLCAARRHVGLSAPEPEDIYQELNLRIIEKIHLFRGEAKFTTWAYQIASNLVLEKVMQAQRRKETAVEDAGEVIAASTDFSRAIDIEVDAELVEAEIERLPEELRKVVRQHFFEEMTCRQIAKANGYKSPQTAANYLNRAINMLRNLLTNNEIHQTS